MYRLFIKKSVQYRTFIDTMIRYSPIIKYLIHFVFAFKQTHFFALMWSVDMCFILIKYNQYDVKAHI